MKIAEGEIIAFLDDDCIPEKKWISTILLNAKKGNILGGKVTNQYDSNLYSESSQLLLDFLYQYNFGTNDQFFTSNNFALFKTDFIYVGEFCTDFITSAGEDREFCVRAKNNGIILHFDKRLKVQHAHYLNLFSFILLHKKYGYAAYEYHLAMIKQNVKIIKRPKTAFYLKLLKYPFQQPNFNLIQRVKIDLLLGLSQLAVAIGYLQNRLFQNKNKQINSKSKVF